MNNVRNVMWIAITAALLSLTNTTEAVVFLAGIDDNFAPPTEPISPSPELAAFVSDLQSFDQVIGLNGGRANASVPHTFAGLPGGITSAILELRIRGGNTNTSGVDTDGIFLSFVDNLTAQLDDDIVWRRNFGLATGGGTVFSDPDSGLVQNTLWSPGDEVFLQLDLSALPLDNGNTVNILADLNNHSFLDVFVGDETAVDFMRLTIETRQTLSGTIPEPITATLGLMGLGVLGMATRRRSMA